MKLNEEETRGWFLFNLNAIIPLKLDCQFYSSFHFPLAGAEANRKVDIMLCPILKDKNGNRISSETRDYEHHWKNLLVVGELKENPKEDSNRLTLIQFCGYAREIFGVQPERRFVHAFSICGHSFRSWVFDRSGGFSSKQCHMQNDYNSVLRYLLEYCRMKPIELGFDPSIEMQVSPRRWDVFLTPKGKGKNIRIIFQGREIKLYETVYCRPCVASRGTVVRKGKEETEEKKEEVRIIKDLWQFAGTIPEGEFWKRAKEKQVWGLAKFMGYEKVKFEYQGDSTNYVIRDKLKFSKENLFNLEGKGAKMKAENDSNREHWRLVFETEGEELFKFKTIKEMLEALRDAVHSKIPSIRSLEQV
jgi:Fungal protein kinase